MRFGQLRGVTLTAALFSAMVIAQSARADGFVKTIPREVLAQDLNTGQPYFAPPIPWGHYAKDGLFDQYYPKAGHFGFLHHGSGGKRCKDCGDSGSGFGGKCGHGLFGHGCGMKGSGCGDPDCGSGHGSARRIKDCGLCKNKGCGFCQSSIVGDPIYVATSSQSPTSHVISGPAASMLGDPGVGSPGTQSMLCDGCAGKGCGKCGFGGLLHKNGGDPCGSCGGKGCGKCGLFGGHARGDGSENGNGCDACGGRGCGKCGQGGGMGGHQGGGMGGHQGGGMGGHLKGKLAGLLHHNKGNIKYFVGAGGPVPLTPGYVPYTVTTRSPRDFLAFPPYTPSEY